ncbi:MAG: hypothetical protein DRP06_02560 [Candidatus Aenigmatarchaeota archaeon]|nr:MAG: hypothetical protein DRP06_02560 [Candidatus Aenigmarchaeota archaeon]
MKNKLVGDLKISPIIYLIVAIFILVVIITFIFNGWNPEIDSVNKENNLRGECARWISSKTGPCEDKLDATNLKGELIYPYLNKIYGMAKDDKARHFCMCPE